MASTLPENLPSASAAPAVAVVDIATLRRLRGAIWGAERAELDKLDADLEHLIAVAEERAWPL